MAETMDTVIEKIKAIQKNARENNDASRPKVAYDRSSYTKRAGQVQKVVDGNQNRRYIQSTPSTYGYVKAGTS